jgi:hypothetical protein
MKFPVARFGGERGTCKFSAISYAWSPTIVESREAMP